MPLSAPSNRSKAVLLIMIAVTLLLAVVLVVTSFLYSRSAEPDTEGTPLGFRRLNEGQYQRSIEHIFGDDIAVPSRFEPELREEGLLAIGGASVVVTPAGFEQYELRAREIAAQVTARSYSQGASGCELKPGTQFDRQCAEAFFSQYGKLLFRRPLNADELAEVMTIAQTIAEEHNDVLSGLEHGLVRLLVSPFFTFRIEAGEASVDVSGERLDPYSLATRISFLLWDAPPDEQLLEVAASGKLYRKKELARQVERMMASPKFEQGVRAFFSDMFAYNQFERLSKEQAIYKKFNSQLAADAKEQNLKTIVKLLINDEADYRDLFTTRKTFMNRNLAAVYRVPVESAAFDGWAPYEFKAEDQRSGILTLAGFLMLDPTHEARTSPTNRGMAVRELLLCQKVPPAPSDVDFTVAQDTHNPVYKTARARLTAHRVNPTCAGCHAIMDPLGLAMENYDTIGQYRHSENGQMIDASGEFEGNPYSDLIELQALLRESPSLTSCLVRRVYEYGIGRTVNYADREWLDYMQGRFIDSGYQLPALLRGIATSSAFSAVSGDDSI